MATGIVSTGLALVGRTVLSLVLLAVAVLGGLVLVAGTTWRLVAYRHDVLHDARNPDRAFGFFTTVAALNVVGVRLDLAGYPTAGLVLAAASVPIWLLLTYAIPGMLMLGPQTSMQSTAVAAEVNGSWFLWVVGTQSLATAAAGLGYRQVVPAAAMAPTAVALWGVGVMLYLTLVSLVTWRLLSTPASPHTLSPAYWIYMGATAITVLAGARILTLPADLPIMQTTESLVAGLTYVLWAFGTWWIPLLVAFGVWRHLLRSEPIRYEAGLWSIVFPLGMYAVASLLFGRTQHLAFMEWIGRVEVWVAVLAWVAVMLAMLLAGRKRDRPRPAQ